MGGGQGGAGTGGRQQAGRRPTSSFADGDGVAEVHGAAAFTDVVAIPRRDFDFDIAGDHALAAEAGFQSEAGGHIQAIGFVVVHFREILHALGDDDVAGGAGTVAATGVLQVDPVVQADVEDRFWLAVLFVRKLSGLELDGLAINGNLRHILLYLVS